MLCLVCTVQSNIKWYDADPDPDLDMDPDIDLDMDLDTDQYHTVQSRFLLS